MIHAAALSLLMFSCNQNGANYLDATRSEYDSTKVADENSPDAFDTTLMYKKFGAPNSLPYSCSEDDVMQLEQNESSKLTGSELKFLTSEYQSLSFEGVKEYYITGAIETDSLAGKLEPGKDTYIQAWCWASNRVRMNKDTDLLIWFLEFESQEGCSASSGRMLFASIFCNRQITGCTLLAKNSEGGEIGLQIYSALACHLAENSFTLSESVITSSEDENELETVDTLLTEYEIRMVDCIWQSVD